MFASSLKGIGIEEVFYDIATKLIATKMTLSRANPSQPDDHGFDLADSKASEEVISDSCC